MKEEELLFTVQEVLRGVVFSMWCLDPTKGADLIRGLRHSATKDGIDPTARRLILDLANYLENVLQSQPPLH